jgi:hypothetical protein
MKVLDLFSGLGGASEAFLTAGHDVLRIENNPLLEKVPNTRLMCIFEFRDWIEEHYANPKSMGDMLMSARFHKIDLIWASPPCDEFSLGYSAPHAIHTREHPNEPYEPDMTYLEATLDIIKLLKPRYYVIENVRGASKFFTEMIGTKPRQILGNAQILWGNFPLIDPPRYQSKAEVDKRHSPLRANIRAKIPIEISQALLDAIENQKCILDYN